MTKTFLRFQLVNLVVSLVVWLAFPISVAGVDLTAPMFIAKTIALIWFNRFPRSSDLASIAFFALACVEVYLMFIYGNFSVYTFLLHRFA